MVYVYWNGTAKTPACIAAWKIGATGRLGIVIAIVLGAVYVTPTPFRPFIAVGELIVKLLLMVQLNPDPDTI